jgi:hypothetical protein
MCPRRSSGIDGGGGPTDKLTGDQAQQCEAERGYERETQRTGQGEDQ